MNEGDTQFQANLATAIEQARNERDNATGTAEGRSLALVVTHLETAALWWCNARAQTHQGDNALTDWLLQI